VKDWELAETRCDTTMFCVVGNTLLPTEPGAAFPGTPVCGVFHNQRLGDQHVQNVWWQASMIADAETTVWCNTVARIKEAREA